MKKKYTTPVMETLSTEDCCLLNGSGNSLNSTRTLQKNSNESEGIDNYEDLL